MKIIKTAVVNLQLSLLQLYIRTILQDQNILSLQQLSIDQFIKKTHSMLKASILKLIKQQLLQQHQIILDIIQNVKPVQICSSCDCDLNVVKLKKIQDQLLNQQFKIKFIL